MIYSNKMVHLILNKKTVFLLLSTFIFMFGQEVSGAGVTSSSSSSSSPRSSSSSSSSKTMKVAPASSSSRGAPTSADAFLPGGRRSCGVASASSGAAADRAVRVSPTTTSDQNYQAREPYLRLHQVEDRDRHGPKGGQHQPNSCCLCFRHFLVGSGICVLSVGIYVGLYCEEPVAPPCGDAEYRLFDGWDRYGYCKPQSDLQCPWTFDERMKTIAPSDVVNQTLQQITDCVNRELLPRQEAGYTRFSFFLGPMEEWFGRERRSFYVSNIPTPWAAGSTSSTSSSGSSGRTQQALQLEHELWEKLQKVLEQQVRKSGNYNLEGSPLAALEHDKALKKMLSDVHLLPEGAASTEDGSAYVTVVDPKNGDCKSFLVTCALDQQEGWGPFTKKLGCEPAMRRMNKRQNRSSRLKEKFGVPEGLELQPRHVIAKCVEDVVKRPSRTSTATAAVTASDLGPVSSLRRGGSVDMEQDGKNAGEAAGPGVLVQPGAEK
ncbi:unnamed protein product [Amoebophrya sp. A120]|nr:unnamed protein product [Amoebophrya sp. A120]|eukprot:GSA120T00023276001.1